MYYIQFLVKKRTDLRRFFSPLGTAIGVNLAVRILHDFVVPVVQESILNLVLRETLGHLFRASVPNLRDGSRLGSDGGENGVMRASVQFAIGGGLFRALVQFRAKLGILGGKLGDVGDVVGDGLHGGLLHSG